MKKSESPQELSDRIRRLKQQNAALKRKVEQLEESSNSISKEKDKKYHTIWDRAPFGIATIDSHNGRFVEINSTYCNIVGYSKSEMLKMDFLQITHPDDLQEDLHNMKRLRSGEIASFRMDKRYICKNGEIVWVSLKVAPLWEKKSEPLFHIAIVNDISEFKKKERSLIENELQLKNLVTNIPGTAYQFIINAEGDFSFSYMGENCIDLFGYTADEILANANLVFDLIPKPDADIVQEAIKKSAVAMKPYDVEHRVIKKNGETVWIQASSTPREANDGGIIWDGIGLNITDQKQSEISLKESEKWFRTIFSLSQQAIGVTEINTGKLVRVNKKLCELAKYTEEELVGKTTTELGFYTEKDRKKFIDELRKSGCVDALEMEFRAKDGSKLTALMFANIIKISDIDYILTIFFDLTRLKILEEELIERNKDLLLAQRIAGVGNWSLDPEIGVSVWSEEVYRIYERDLELGPYPLDEYPTIYRGKWWEIFRGAIQGAINDGKPYDIELKLQLPSGKEKWIHAICQPHAESGPKGYYLQGTIQDISNRKRAEDALKESEEKFRILFESSKDANYISTIEGRVLEANQSFMELFDYELEDLHNLRTQDLYVNPDDRVVFTNEIKRKGFAKDFEEKLQDKNGNVMDCQITATFRRSADGTIVGYQGVIRDVTDIKRKQIEKEKLIFELQEALAQIKTLSGLLPICSHCKKIRDDKGYWNKLEAYIQDHSNAEFSHGICQECAKKYYPDMDLYGDDANQG